MLRGNQEELSYPFARAGDSVDVLWSDILVAEIVEDSDGRVDIIVVIHFEGREDLTLIPEFLVFE